ncbi:MAG: hypothetical protein J0L99_04905 [Chitinophagales bacterium]|nr:hypothetical protein [Chitinophagales bacterium]
MFREIIRRSFPLPVLLASALLLFSNCNKDDGLEPGFDMLYEQEFVIPPGINVFDLHSFRFDNIRSLYATQLGKQGLTDADIKGVVTKRAAMIGVFNDADFSMMEEVSLRLYDGVDPSKFIEAAYRFPTPTTRSNNFDLIPSLADSKKYAAQDRFGMDVTFRIRNIPTQETRVRVSLELRALFK